jgi:hypothetical protein
MAQRQYVAAIARELGRHAVWEPGLALDVGDYGKIFRGTFVKLGNLADFSIGPIQRSSTTKIAWSFASTGVTTDLVAGKADAVVGEAKLLIECGKKESLFIRSSKSSVQQVNNLQRLADALQAIPRWRSRWKVVREVRSIESGLVLISKSSGGTIELVGRLDEIQGLDNVGVKVGASVRVSGDTSDSYLGVNGPILLGLVRIIKNPLFGRDSVRDMLASTPTENRPARIEEVSPGPGLTDDPEEAL